MIGLYGIIGHLVSRRLFEIGVRMALGATQRSVVALILQSATYVTATGAALGALASLIVLPALRPLLATGQTALDPLAIAGVAAILVISGALASWWPARRATTVDPTVALKSE
jgi:ABC-type antimicrobial peptide transport system permease subunit